MRRASAERRFVGGHSQQGFHFLAVRNAPVANALVVFTQNAGGALDLGWDAFDFQIVVAQMGGDVKGDSKMFQIFVEGAEKFVDAPGDVGRFVSSSVARLLCRRANPATSQFRLARVKGRVKAVGQDSCSCNLPGANSPKLASKLRNARNGHTRFERD